MRGQICLMPAKCMKCDKVFDISHDFKGSDESLAEKEMDLEKGQKKLLCWECRVNEQKPR